MTAPSVEGIVTSQQLQETIDAIAEWQLPNGMIPWFPGGHADPWNHVEAAMALTLGDRMAEAERAYDWLISRQRRDGSWHQYYLADGVEQDKLDANTIAYVAAGAWHHLLLTKDNGFAETLWPVVDRAIEFVLALQTDRGEILWARHADGTPWSFALLTGSSSICHSLRCALALAHHLGQERPWWEDATARLATVIRSEPDAFAPKHRWAMDWYYPVLSGVLTGLEGRERLGARLDAFLIEGRGVRCVSDRPWVTVAETCECALAHLALGERDTAERLFGWAQQYREPGGRYWTGTVYPEGVHFPGGEQSTYTAAAVVLAADGISGAGPASELFVDHDAVLPSFDDVAELDQYCRPGLGVAGTIACANGRTDTLNVGAARLWASTMIRRHWRASAALSVLFGIAFGFIGAAVAAERRADTALARYQNRGTTYDAVVNSCPPGVDPSTFGEDFSKFFTQCLNEDRAARTSAELAKMPEVRATTYGSYHVVGVYDRSAPNGWGRVALLVSTKTPGSGFGENEPIIVRGRKPGRDATDEIVVNETAATEDGIDVGDRLTIGSWPPDQLDQAVQGGIAPNVGPVVMRVVGVGRFNSDLSPNGDPDVSGSQLSGQLYATGGTHAAFRDYAGYGVAALVQLRGGLGARGEFEKALGRRWGDRFFRVDQALDVDPSVIEHVIDNERRAVLVVAGIALAATIGFAGLTLVRQLAREQYELPVLTALGFDRRDLVGASFLRTAVIAVGAAALAIVAAVALSPLEPVGLARRVDPDRGVHLDVVVVLGAGLAAAVVASAIGAAVPLVVRRRRPAVERPRPRLEAAATRLGPSATTGFALSGGGWRRVAAVVTGLAIVGLVAAGVTVHSLDRVLAQPARFGAWWDVAMGDYSDKATLDRDIPAVVQRPEVETAAGIMEQDEAATIDGHAAPLVGFVPYRGNPQPVMASGRPPHTTSEIALGRDTMRSVGAHTGGTVTLAPTGGSSSGKKRVMTVTGVAVLDNPIQLSIGAGDGAYVLPEVVQSLTPGIPQSILVRFKPGVDRDAAIRRLAHDYRGSIHPVTPQDDLRNLDRLRTVPWTIAGLLGLLALATVVHALVTMVSGNRRNLAVLMVLGARRTLQARATLWAAAFTVLGAVLVGVPAGLVAGRALWRFLALGINIPDDPVTPILTTLGLVVGALLLTEGVAWAAARRARGRNLAAELRRD